MKELSFSHFPLPRNVCFGRKYLCFFSFSTFIFLILNVLSHWLVLVPERTKHKFCLIETSGGCVQSHEGSRVMIWSVLKSILPVLPTSCSRPSQCRKDNLYK